MSIIINGTGTISGVSSTGLTTAQTVTQSAIATGVAGTGPAFSAFLNTAQSVNTATWSKIQINTEEFDTNNNFDSTTNYRFTPTVAGYYQVNGWISSSLSSATNFFFGGIYKNGVANKYGINAVGTSNGATTNVVALIYLNGTTDYVELYVYSSLTTALNTGLTNTYFQASLVRAA